MPTESRTRSPEAGEIRRQQAALLRRYLADTVLPFSAHYKKLGIDPEKIRTLDDLRRIPFTTKRDVQDGSKDFILIPDKAVLARRPSTILNAVFRGKKSVEAGFEHEFRPIMLTSTTGRSSDPVPFLYTEHDIVNLRLCGRRMMEYAGATRDMRVLNMFPFAPHLAFWLTHYAGTEFGCFNLSTGGGKVMGTDGNLRMLEKIAPDAIVAMPTFAYHVLQEAVTNGVKCKNLKKIVLGGEKVPPGMRTKLRELAMQAGAQTYVDIHATYGFTEAKLAWVQGFTPEGKAPSGYQLHPDLGITEIVDPKTGEPVGEGEPGEIVFTPLDARGSVVLRYRTGDFIDGGVVYSKCPYTGREGPRLAGEIGRSSEIREMRIDKLKGTLVDFNKLEHILDDFKGVGSWQIELRKVNDDPLDLDEVILHIQKTDSSEEESRMRDRIGSAVVSGLELHPNLILFHDAEAMRRIQGVGSQLKEQRIVDHRPKAGNSTPPFTPAKEAGKHEQRV